MNYMLILIILIFFSANNYKKKTIGKKELNNLGNFHLIFKNMSLSKLLLCVLD